MNCARIYNWPSLSFTHYHPHNLDSICFYGNIISNGFKTFLRHLILYENWIWLQIGGHFEMPIHPEWLVHLKHTTCTPVVDVQNVLRSSIFKWVLSCEVPKPLMPPKWVVCKQHAWDRQTQDFVFFGLEWTILKQVWWFFHKKYLAKYSGWQVS